MERQTPPKDCLPDLKIDEDESGHALPCTRIWIAILHMIRIPATKTLLTLNYSLGLQWHSFFYGETLIVCNCLAMKVHQRCCKHIEGSVKEPLPRLKILASSRALLILDQKFFGKWFRSDCMLKWLHMEVISASEYESLNNSSLQIVWGSSNKHEGTAGSSL